MTAPKTHCVCRTLIGLGLGLWASPTTAQTPDIPDIPVVATTSAADSATDPVDLAGPGQGPRLAPAGPRTTSGPPPTSSAAPPAPPSGPGEAVSLSPELFASCAQLWSATPSPSCAAALEPARGVIQGCQAAHPPAHRDSWRLTFEITDGAPGDVRIEPAEAANSPLGRCLATSIPGLRFSRSETSTPVVLDLNLSADKTLNSAAPPPNPAAPDAAWATYHAAFIESVIGRKDRAEATLTKLREAHPKHPASLLAADLLLRLGTDPTLEAPPRPEDEVDERYGSLEPTGLARAELASYQTFAGIGAAGLFCGLAECDDARLWVAVLTLGGGAGLTGSLLATRKNGITPGRALAINTATTWGIWNGIAIAVAADTGDNGVPGTILTGQLLGLGAGIVLALNTNPTAGDVSMSASAGLWTGGLWFLFQGMTDFKMINSGEALVLSTAIAGDLGLVAGALLTRFEILRMSRSRALLIDSGGVLGTLLGLGLSVLIKGDVDSAPAFFGPGLFGMLTGVIGTFYLTRNWDEPNLPDVALGISPLQDGGMALSMGGRF